MQEYAIMGKTKAVKANRAGKEQLETLRELIKDINLGSLHKRGSIQ